MQVVPGKRERQKLFLFFKQKQVVAVKERLKLFLFKQMQVVPTEERRTV